MEKDSVKEFHIELLKTLQIVYSSYAVPDRFVAIIKFLEGYDNSNFKGSSKQIVTE